MTKSAQAPRWAGLLAFALTLAACQSCQGASNDGPEQDGDRDLEPTVTFLTSPDPVTVGVRVADEPAERTQGLMYVESMPEFEGMIFVFPNVSDAAHPR